MESKTIKIVPETLEDITAEWCEKILHEGGTISKETKVTKVEVLPIIEESSGCEDGGGFSGSTIIKLVPTYGENASGNEPATMVCKISGTKKRNISFTWRLIFEFMMPQMFDNLNRHETLFYQKVVPLLENSSFRFPKVYFSGLDDKGNNNFFQSVIMNKPSPVKSILVMEDLSDWKVKIVGTMLSQNEIILCLKNIACMHARFWGEKKKDIEEFLSTPMALANDKTLRKSKYQNSLSAWNENRWLSSSEKIKKSIDSMLASEWRTDFTMKIPKNCKLPSWFTLQPQEDGTYQSMDEPMIKEMLSVYAERLPKYYQENLSEFRSREVEGLCHGDFHTGNHMFGGKDGEEDKVIVYDFQGAGPGLVSKEVVRMLACMEIENYDQVLEITKEYHNSLVDNGVTDYDWLKFKKDIEMALVDSILMLLSLCTGMKPKQFFTMYTAITGEGKAEQFKKVFESGMMSKSMITLTCLYVQNKDNFMV